MKKDSGDGQNPFSLFDFFVFVVESILIVKTLILSNYQYAFEQIRRRAVWRFS
jgi:hypothetical protein